MNVLVIGSGGREHALVWKLSQSRIVTKLYCAPGNPGIGELAELVNVKASDLKQLAEFASTHSIDLTVVGPEDPLANGLVDEFEQRGLAVFGPTRRASELEWSKAFAKDFMQRYNIPTAAYRTFRQGQQAEAREYLAACPLPIVLKADGLAAGKGVVVCERREDAFAAFADITERKTFGRAGDAIVVEDFLRGTEASVFAICDGRDFVTLAPAQDHKRALDDDLGKNTGGMGAYAPAPMMTEALMIEVEQKIIAPVIRAMVSEGRPYRGCLYVGLMLTGAGPKVVEFNCRFGDPETQVILPIFEGDLLELLYAAVTRKLWTLRIKRSQVSHGHAACVVLASGGYPDSYPTNIPIHGLDTVSTIPGVIAFQAGTRLDGDRIVTAGGRVIGLTAFVPEGSLQDAIATAYHAITALSFEGMHYRHDIGRKAIDAEVPGNHQKGRSS